MGRQVSMSRKRQSARFVKLKALKVKFCDSNWSGKVLINKLVQWSVICSVWVTSQLPTIMTIGVNTCTSNLKHAMHVLGSNEIACPWTKANMDSLCNIVNHCLHPTTYNYGWIRYQYSSCNIHTCRQLTGTIKCRQTLTRQLWISTWHVKWNSACLIQWGTSHIN